MSATLAFNGLLAGIPPAARQSLCRRTAARDDHIVRQVSAIVARVRRDGDAALRDLAKEFDRATIRAIEVPRREWNAALGTIDPAVRAALERAAANIRQVHEAFRPTEARTVTGDGVLVVRRPDPLARVGVYAPGGRAAYPSSLLMGAVPARVAGAGEVVVCSPPGQDGVPARLVLAAAAIAGVDRVFAIGGAGAIAAMAYGTDSVPAVDRIVGPGNAWVTEGKRQVMADVPIDAPAGPSELLVVADDSADADAVAREMVAQAEHDPMATAVLVTDSARLAAATARHLDTLAQASDRRDLVVAALRSGGGVLLARSIDEATAFAADYAPEHLLLLVRDPDAVLGGVRHAGTVFVGASSSVAFGDYLTGANHVLPTGGAARQWSGLSTSDFVRWTTCQFVPEASAWALARDTELLASAEGLPAHAAAARAWRRS